MGTPVISAISLYENPSTSHRKVFPIAEPPTVECGGPAFLAGKDRENDKGK